MRRFPRSLALGLIANLALFLLGGTPADAGLFARLKARRHAAPAPRACASGRCAIATAHVPHVAPGRPVVVRVPASRPAIGPIYSAPACASGQCSAPAAFYR